MDKILRFIVFNIGIFFVSFNIYVFLAPNEFAAGGLGGLTIVLHSFFPNLPIGLLMLILNVILFVIGFFFLGFEFGVKTIYASFASSIMVWAMENLFPLSGPISHDKFIQLVVGTIIASFGLVIVLKQNASTGGMDLLGMIVNKYFSIDIGKSVLMFDFSIAILSIVAFGLDNSLYAIFGIVFRSALIDYFTKQFNIRKEAVIVSQHCDQIKTFITNELGIGATVYSAKGAYTNENKEVIHIVVNRQEFVKLKKYINRIDEKAFITVHEATEVHKQLGHSPS
ncbi:YitT family protein [Bacillus sp. 03113]|uniref:YitT family protein n=1 Tax=Bacillus sp. 03113 TaxID=2578211 RepID=UPI0011414DF2|nr:YitT family protein [Bacillus sp. 03113]